MMRPPRWVGWTLSLIILMALAMRLYPVIYLPEKDRGGIGMFGDSFLYHTIAVNLYQGHGFSGTNNGMAFGESQIESGKSYEPAITRAPLYPFFMCTVYKLFGSYRDTLSPETWHKNWDKVRIAQCVMDSFLCLILFLIVRSIYPMSWIPALLAALLYAFNPYNIFYTRALLTESVTTFLVTLGTWMAVLALQGKKMAWFLTGLLWGLVVLCRPEYIIFPLFFIGLSAALKLKTASLKNLIVMIIGVVVIISPWTVRNFIVFKKPIPVSVNAMGCSLFLGTFESNTNWTGWEDLPSEIFKNAEEEKEIKSLYQAHIHSMQDGTIRTKELDNLFLKHATQRIREHPWKTFATWIGRLPRLWYQWYIPMYRDHEASGGFFIFYFIAALYAFFKLSNPEKNLVAPIVILFFFVNLIYLPFHIEPRYSVPCLPGILCLTAIGIWKLTDFLFLALFR